MSQGSQGPPPSDCGSECPSMPPMSEQSAAQQSMGSQGLPPIDCGSECPSMPPMSQGGSQGMLPPMSE
jgi:hypothetical protein